MAAFGMFKAPPNLEVRNGNVYFLERVNLCPAAAASWHHQNLSVMDRKWPW